MGEPVKIVDLARDMISLSGLEPDKDVKIVFTGLRLGEKLYEELLTEGEEIKSTLHEKIKVAKSDSIDWTSLFVKIELLMESLRSGFSHDVVSRIKEIVPEFQPENGGPEIIVPALREGSTELFDRLPGKRMVPGSTANIVTTDARALKVNDLPL
jgi:FlaA1/EpsC-like NDP-sugar epimerase